MNAIQLPELRFPFPSRVSPRANDAQQHLNNWAQAYGLLSTDEALMKFDKSRFAWLVARTFPDAPFEELCLIADFNAWLFLFDDQCDEAAQGKKSAYLRTIMTGLLDILRNNKVYSPVDAGPFPAALSDIWARMRAISKPAWRLKFIRSVQDYFEACIWESENREAGQTPSVKEYVRMRPFTGALLADVDAIDIIEKIYLPEDMLQNAILQRMIQACNNVVCWTNDIISCQKEALQGDVHNLVLVLHHEKKYSLQEAVNEATQMTREELAIFLVLERLLPTLEGYGSYELLRFVSVLQSWMIGNYEWAVLDTKRYQLGQTVLVG